MTLEVDEVGDVVFCGESFESVSLVLEDSGFDAVGVRDRTRAGSFDAVNGNAQGACSGLDLVNDTAALRAS